MWFCTRIRRGQKQRIECGICCLPDKDDRGFRPGSFAHNGQGASEEAHERPIPILGDHIWALAGQSERL